MVQVNTQALENSETFKAVQQPFVKDERTEPSPDKVANAQEVKSDGTQLEKVEQISGFNIEEINKIRDPHARQLLQEKYKAMQSDYTSKLQKLSEEKKSLNQPWSVDRIASLMNDKEFIQAANLYTQALTPNEPPQLDEDEYSNLTEKERQTLSAIKQEINNLKMENDKLKLLKNFENQHEKLKDKYSDYDKEAVEKFYNDLTSFKVQAGLEEVWKVYNYDKAKEQSYKLGYEDGLKQRQERLNASSIDSRSISVSNSEKPTQNEKPSDFIKRILIKNLKQS
jgi:hypothetical protein